MQSWDGVGAFFRSTTGQAVVYGELNKTRATSNASLTSDDTAALCLWREQGAERVPADSWKGER